MCQRSGKMKREINGFHLSVSHEINTQKLIEERGNRQPLEENVSIGCKSHIWLLPVLAEAE